MSKINIDADHNPKTAFFWASFATEDEQQQKHCPTVTLYRNSEGKFFAVQASPGIDPAGLYTANSIGRYSFMATSLSRLVSSAR